MEWLFDEVKTVTSEGAAVNWIDHRYFTLEFEGISYHGEILDDLSEDHKLTLKINQRVFNIRRKHALDDLIAALGLDKVKTRKIKAFNSPMPGRILSLWVEVGQEVNPGDPLLSLEAMKMENTLKSEGLGRVKALLVTVGSVVEKGARLIEFE